MKKLTDDDANELLAVIATDFIRPEEIKKTWRECGLLEFDETPLEKARRLLAEYKKASYIADYDINDIVKVANAYEAVITHLKASAWTGPLIDEYARYFYANRKRDIPSLLPEAWLAHPPHRRRRRRVDGITEQKLFGSESAEDIT